MKSHLLVVISAAIFAASQAYAEDKGQAGGERRQELIQKLKEADKDGDGKLSREEAPEKLKEHFDEVDKNKDGYVDHDEMRDAFQARAKQMVLQSIIKRLREADKNGDEKLSMDEAPPQLKKNFAKVDTNSDGFVDKEEATKALGQLTKMYDAFQDWVERLKEADKDGDKKLSKDEAPDELKKHFAEIDDNSDGLIDGEELRKAIGEYIKQHQEGASDEAKEGTSDKAKETP